MTEPNLLSQGCIVTIAGEKYNVAAFLDAHPGGRAVLAKYNGQDATEAFTKVGHSHKAKELMLQYLIKADKDLTVSIRSDPPKATKDPLNNHFVWYIVTALVAAVSVILSTFTKNLATDLQNARPKTGELGQGRFQIIGYQPNTTLNYPFRLAVPTVSAISTAWVGYLAHQIGQMYILFIAKRAYDSNKLQWTDSGSVNPYARLMTRFNMLFVVLHALQSYLFYDGLAASVPEITAQGSVISMLVVVYILEIPRRGLIVNKNPFRRKALVTNFCQFVKKYHGYVASFGVVYNFWYHPLEATAAHLTGFTFQFLLIWQSSLLFQNEHRNRYWTTFVEFFVTVHGFVTAFFQTGTVYLMFLFGFLGVFILMQIWGLPIVQSFLYNEKMELDRTRYYIVLGGSIGVYLVAAIIGYFAAGSIGRVWMIINIPLVIYGVILEYFFFYALGMFFYDRLIRYIKPDSTLMYFLATLYSFGANIAILCAYTIFFGGDLKIPKETRLLFGSSS